MGIVLTNGTIVTATDTYKADLRIKGEKIVSMGKNVKKATDTEISVSGCLIFPGGIDPHTHFDLDSNITVTADDFESGTKAALKGGTTTIIDFINHKRGETLSKSLKNWHKKSEEKCYCDYGFHMTLAEWDKNISDEMGDIVKNGITSFKMYMAYKDLQVSDNKIYKALKRSKELGALICFHCENGDIVEALIDDAKKKNNNLIKYHSLTRPDLVEEEAVNRLIYLAKLADAPAYIVHISTKGAVASVIEAKKRGLKVFAETCPHYLVLDKSRYEQKDSNDFEPAKYVMSPPLRSLQDNSALWSGIYNSVIDTVATDHCSFNYKGQKNIGLKDFTQIPNGIPGVEHRLTLLYTYGVCENKISLNQMVSVFSTNSSKIFGLYPKKGTIAIGSDADIIVFDPDYKTTITAENQIQNVDYTPYEGFKQRGRILHLFLRGNQVIKDGNIVCKTPLGRFVKRKRFK